MNQREPYNEIVQELLAAKAMLDRLLDSPATIMGIAAAGTLIAEAIEMGSKVIACGNGGSMSDAMHFTAELTGRFRYNRRPLPAIAICDPTYLSATANDYAYSDVFARFVKTIGNPGDVLLAITTSGESENVARAVDAAHDRTMKVVALTGKEGGKISGRVDVEIRSPHSPHSDRTQEIHIKVLHILATLIEKHLNIAKE